MDTIPQVTFGEDFRWHAGRRSVHRSCTLDGGQGRIRRIEIYIPEEALMDAERLTATPKTDELVSAAKRLWDSQIYPVVKRRIKADEVDPDGTLLITSRELEEQRRPAPDFRVHTPRNPRI
jgi:hypothetical protein